MKYSKVKIKLKKRTYKQLKKLAKKQHITVNQMVTDIMWGKITHDLEQRNNDLSNELAALHELGKLGNCL